MSAVLSYAVTVTLDGEDDSTLLRLVSTLHRRRVQVLEAELTRPGRGRTFVATFLADPGRAAVVAASLRNLVEVEGVELRETLAAGPSNLVPIGLHLADRRAEGTRRAAR